MASDIRARGSQQQLPSRQAVEIFDLGPDVRIEITGAIRLVRFEWRRRIEARLRLLREPVHHGRIEVRAGSFWISDLGSTNGTQVNGQQVIEKQLTDGDMIAIGQNTLRFTLES